MFEQKKVPLHSSTGLSFYPQPFWARSIQPVRRRVPASPDETVFAPDETR
jgi:hypothetical protein